MKKVEVEAIKYSFYRDNDRNLDERRVEAREETIADSESDDEVLCLVDSDSDRGSTR